MSIGSMGIISSVAGTQLAQISAADKERLPHDTTDQKRQLQGVEKAEAAAGIGEADSEKKGAEERDADGRRLWEETGTGRKDQEPSSDEEKSEQEKEEQPPQSIDVTGTCGGSLDLTI